MASISFFNNLTSKESRRTEYLSKTFRNSALKLASESGSGFTINGISSNLTSSNQAVPVPPNFPTKLKALV